MSLDVHLSIKGAGLVSTEPEIFIREGGQMKRLTRPEWDERWPGREPVTVTHDEPSDNVYSANITHNLNTMAEAAGIYYALWHPAELNDAATAELIRAAESAHNYHDAGGVYELERTLPVCHASNLIEPLTTGLALLKSDPERFKAFNPPNGWGTYEGLVSFVEEYLAACQEYPKAEVSVSR